jgi:hypothetical protein
MEIEKTFNDLKEQHEMLSQIILRLCEIMKNIAATLTVTTKLEKEELCLKQKIRK